MADRQSTGSSKKKQKGASSGHDGKLKSPTDSKKSGSSLSPMDSKGQHATNPTKDENVKQVIESSGILQSPGGVSGLTKSVSELKVEDDTDETDSCEPSGGTTIAAAISQQGIESTEVADSASQKSKAQLRAERRAIQEAQRAAKAASKVAGTGAAPKKESGGKGGKPSGASQQGKSEGGPSGTDKVAAVKGTISSTGAVTTTVKKVEQTTAGGGGFKDSKLRVPDSMQVDDEKVVKRQLKKLDKQNVPQRPTGGQKKVNSFKHLVQYERTTAWTHEYQLNKPVIHKAIRKLGLQYMNGTVCGSNARCIALLMALKEVIADYKTPPNTEISRDLEPQLRPLISFLNQCRPLSVSMGNAIKYLKHQISQVKSDLSETQAKQLLLNSIDVFVNERIQLADKAISEQACSNICDGDVILVYSCSSLVRKVLRDAHKNGIQFTVIVADSRPMLEGKVMLQRLVSDGIKCSYVLINSVSYVMREVAKVLLGAHALLANGFVMSRVGSSQIAMIAKTYNIPVLVCCETYKFCERVQTDSFVFNELGDPDDLTKVKNEMLSSWRTTSHLYVLNLVYDVTPAELLSAVITELGSLPSTSVPVVLRVKYSES